MKGDIVMKTLYDHYLKERDRLKALNVWEAYEVAKTGVYDLFYCGGDTEDKSGLLKGIITHAQGLVQQLDAGVEKKKPEWETEVEE